MPEIKPEPFDEPIYSTRLSPHRSMTPRAFYLFIVAFCLAQVIFAIPFLVMGAWPVAGFMGLDALALYVAFLISFRDARAYETLDVTPLELVFAKVGAGGRRREWRFNPSWVRLEQKVHEEFGTMSVTLVSRGETIEVGSFLGPDQKAKVARELARALAIARLGPRFS
ncbi:DUF2244 domain-containing protein [Methylocystis sp. S23]|jgi:uncharacterized membrane protein